MRLDIDPQAVQSHGVGRLEEALENKWFGLTQAACHGNISHMERWQETASVHCI
jgi:hypothetical protein